MYRGGMVIVKSHHHVECDCPEFLLALQVTGIHNSQIGIAELQLCPTKIHFSGSRLNSAYDGAICPQNLTAVASVPTSARGHLTSTAM